MNGQLYRKYRPDPKVHPRIELEEAMAEYARSTGRPAVVCCTNIALRQRLRERVKGYPDELPLEVLDPNWVVDAYFYLSGESGEANRDAGDGDGTDEQTVERDGSGVGAPTFPLCRNERLERTASATRETRRDAHARALALREVRGYAGGAAAQPPLFALRRADHD